MKKEIGNTTKKILFALFISLMVLGTGGVWLRIGSYDRLIISKAAFFAIGVLLSTAYMIRANGRIQSRMLVMIIFVMCMWFINISGNTEYLADSVQYFMAPMIVFLLIGGLAPEEDILQLFSIFVGVMLVISIVSIFFYILGSRLHILLPDKKILYLWGDPLTANSYHGLFYEPIMMGQNGLKNCSIFAEPPMYSFLLTTAYTLQRTFLKKNNYITLVLMAALLTTFSTTGIVAVLIFEGICLFQKMQNKLLNTLRIVSIPMLLVAGGIGIFILLSKKTLTGSFRVRNDHLLRCIQVIKETFPFGCGFGNSEAVLTGAVYKQGLSIGLPYFFAQGGIAAIAVFFVPFLFYLVKSIKTKRIKHIAFALSFFWVVFCTNLSLNSSVQWGVMMWVFSREMLAK